MNAKDFNSGKPVESSDGGSQFDPVVWKVVDVNIVDASKTDHPLAKAVAARDNKAQMIQIDLVAEKGEKHTEYQVLKINDKGVVIFYSAPRSEYKGNTYPATFLYDLKQSALEFDAKQADQLSKPFSKDRYVGIKFKIGTKFGTSKEGNDFTILETDYQKLKNEEYQASQKQVDEAMGDDAPAEDGDDLPF